jgi:membrane-bound serine protease (ClpP class)
VLSEKVTNDAVAFITSIAEERDRNVRWAQSAVRRSASVSAREAVRLDVIDGVAATASGALRFADGRESRVSGEGTELDTWPASVSRESISLGRGLLGSLIDPNLAYLLFVLGIVGLVIEIFTPGLGVPGAGGLLSLVLSLVMLEMLPVNLAGVLLVLAGVVLLIVELHVPGFGLPGIAGFISLVLGGLLLFDAGALVRVSRPLLLGTAIGMALFVLIVLGKVVRARRLPPVVPTTLVGTQGLARTDLDPVGTVRVGTEDWTAKAMRQPIKAGAPVRVVDEEGLTLHVDAIDEGRT